MIEKLLNWWQGLARRERKLTAVAGGIVAFGLIFLLAIEPAWKTRKRLEVELPRLQGELVQIEALHDEIRQLKDRAGGVQTSESLHAAAVQSIKRANIVGEVAKQGDNAISITARNVSATKWFRWLETFVREARVQVVAARVERVSTGRVDVSVTFGTAPAIR